MAALGAISIGLIAVAGAIFFRLWEGQTGTLDLAAISSKRPTAPAGPGPIIKFQRSGFSQSDEARFLAADFAIIGKVNGLPHPVLVALTETGNPPSRMANPGEKFNATDYIRDPTEPRTRLIFAGVFQDRCFVHYERGGRAHEYLLAFFMLKPEDRMVPLFQAHCGRARTLNELRALVSKGQCPEPTP
jgi:hypothetical protein